MELAPEVIDLIRRTADGFPWGPQRRRYMADTIESLGLGQRQAQLGRMQSDLGMQQSAIAAKADVQVRALIRDAVRSGLAKPVQ